MNNKHGRARKPRYALTVTLLLLVSLAPLTEGSTARAANESADLTALERQVYELVNAHRTAMGLAPLAYSEGVAASARQHSRDMALGYVGVGHEGAEKRRDSLSRTISFSRI